MTRLRMSHRGRRLGVWLVSTLVLTLSSAVSTTLEAQAGTRRLLYVGVPGVGASPELGGRGVLVFDIDRGHELVRRIPLAPPGAAAESVRGIAAHAGTARLYVATSRRMVALDLVSDRVVWESDFGDRCCDRMALSPDGSFMYVPMLGRPIWYVVSADDGSIIGTIDRTGSAHNTIISDDGRFGYLANQNGDRRIGVVDTRTHTVVRDIGPFGHSTRPFTINGRQTHIYVNVNDLLGFEVGDLATGAVLHRVEVEGFEGGRSPIHGIPSHGIAMTADETEIWVADNANNHVHIFDATVMPPVQEASIALRGEPGWISFGIDATLAYPSTGDVIDVRTRQIVGTLQDELDRDVHSEKIVEVDFESGRPVRVSDQFGKGAVR